jgi:hypothetical protein
MVVCQEGYIEISPGVYAPKMGVPALKPRKPFEFDDDDMLKVVEQGHVC